ENDQAFSVARRRRRGSFLVRSSHSQVSGRWRSLARKTINDQGRNMKARVHASRRVVLAITAALAACSAKVDKQNATAGSVRDSAGGNVSAVPATPRQSDTTYGPANHMGRIPVLEYH